VTVPVDQAPPMVATRNVSTEWAEVVAEPASLIL
jgi:hypothetical protein